jgi:hypothetical protein
MLKTYTGGCHCGNVRFTADLDLTAGTSRCNCSICTKTRQWGIIVKPDAFRQTAGEGELSDYQFGEKSAHHLFCRTCGVHSFGRGFVEAIGGDYVSVAVACLDIEPADMAAAPINYMDGRHDNWWSAPAQTSYL